MNKIFEWAEKPSGSPCFELETSTATWILGELRRSHKGSERDKFSPLRSLARPLSIQRTLGPPTFLFVVVFVLSLVRAIAEMVAFARELRSLAEFAALCWQNSLSHFFPLTSQKRPL